MALISAERRRRIKAIENREENKGEGGEKGREGETEGESES